VNSLLLYLHPWSWCSLQAHGAKWPWTQTVSYNKSFFFNLFSQVFWSWLCKSNYYNRLRTCHTVNTL
jgi:hypothetical protein